jgi:hypothetical protein
MTLFPELEPLRVGSSCYIIIEAFKPYRYEIIDAKVRLVPHKGLKEYDLNHNGNLYNRRLEAIYRTYVDAIKKAEEMADNYDKHWSYITGEKMERRWRRSDDK